MAICFYIEFAKAGARADGDGEVRVAVLDGGICSDMN
jgi:hypothetical protein